MESTFEERLLQYVKEELDSSLEYYELEGDPEICDDICQALEVCNKLLDYNYYKKSDELFDKLNIRELKPEELKKIIKNIKKVCQKERIVKQRDLCRLFDILVQHVGDWC